MYFVIRNYIFILFNYIFLPKRQNFKLNTAQLIMTENLMKPPPFAIQTSLVSCYSYLKDERAKIGNV